jgi:cytochrome c1
VQWKSKRLALICAAALPLSIAFSAARRHVEANPDPPATPQATTTQPATHFTQGTITSIEANHMVITKKVRRKAESMSFAINSQTQLSGNLVAGTRVSVQYREVDHQNIAAAVRELPADSTVKPSKTAYKHRLKS